jgi:hypothetical protein
MGMAGGGKGGGGGGKGGGGSSGLSPFDTQAIMAALGNAQAEMHNRYQQLGLGVPSGDPAQAAASGQSLSYSGPSTMELQDTSQMPSQQGGLGQIAQALLGQAQQSNLNNPAIQGQDTAAASAAGTLASGVLGNA